MELDVLAFGAHADDIELACGATLIKLVKQGYKVGACDLTEGELSTRGTVEIRAGEAREAAKIIGLAVRENLGLPDGDIQDTIENRLSVIKILRKYRPRIVFAPYWKCRHYDHIRASDLVSASCYYSGLRKIDSGQENHRPNLIIYFPQHNVFDPSFVVDISEEFEQKMETIRAHRSQFFDPQSSEPQTFISSEYFMESIVTRCRLMGNRIGTEYGEGFFVRETMRIDDPVRFFGNLDPSRIMLRSK